MSSLRQDILLKIAANGKGVKGETQRGQKRVDLFGVNAFNDQVMRERLPKDVYEKLRDTIRKGATLDLSIANTVAHAMKEWAISRGCTHFTHWFQPQTGLTQSARRVSVESISLWHWHCCSQIGVRRGRHTAHGGNQGELSTGLGEDSVTFAGG